MQGKNFDIFISYRRSDGEPIARIITETLKGKNYRCFLDYDKLKGGKFDERIEKAIKDAPIFIAVMTPDYLVRPKEDKEKDLSEEEKENQGEDWVYKEIEIANANNKYIISINHNKKIKSIPKEVPANIAKALGAHTFAEVHDGQTYASNMEDLIKGWISEIVPPPTEKTQGKANIEVSSDADCDILKTGEVIATIAKGGYNILKLPHGEHRLVCRSNEFSDIEQEVKLDIAKDLPDAFFDVKLEKRIKPRRKKREREKKREERRIEREKRKAEKAKIREEQNLDNQKRREERNRYWEETLRPLFRKIGKWCVMLLAVIAGAVAGTWCIKNCEGTTETATETAVETPAIEQNVIEVVETPAMEIQEEPWINEEEEQRQAEIERQKAQQERKRQAEEKKNRDEKKFNEYKAKGDEYYLLLAGSPDNKSYKDQAKYYYGLALQYKEDAKVRNRFETLKR